MPYSSTDVRTPEAERDNLFPGLESYVDASSAFRPLLKRKVTFYDRAARQSLLFVPKNALEDKELKGILDMEDNPNEYLDFLEVDEKYIDD